MGAKIAKSVLLGATDFRQTASRKALWGGQRQTLAYNQSHHLTGKGAADVEGVTRERWQDSRGNGWQPLERWAEPVVGRAEDSLRPREKRMRLWAWKDLCPWSSGGGCVLGKKLERPTEEPKFIAEETLSWGLASWCCLLLTEQTGKVQMSCATHTLFHRQVLSVLKMEGTGWGKRHGPG